MADISVNKILSSSNAAGNSFAVVTDTTLRLVGSQFNSRWNQYSVATNDFDTTPLVPDENEVIPTYTFDMNKAGNPVFITNTVGNAPIRARIYGKVTYNGKPGRFMQVNAIRHRYDSDDVVLTTRTDENGKYSLFVDNTVDTWELSCIDEMINYNSQVKDYRVGEAYTPLYYVTDDGKIKKRV